MSLRILASRNKDVFIKYLFFLQAKEKVINTWWHLRDHHFLCKCHGTRDAAQCSTRGFPLGFPLIGWSMDTCWTEERSEISQPLQEYKWNVQICKCNQNYHSLYLFPCLAQRKCMQRPANHDKRCCTRHDQIGWRMMSFFIGGLKIFPLLEHRKSSYF